MYDPQLLLQQIDANRAQVLLLFGIDSVFQIAWLVAAVRVARRDRAYSIPLFCTYFWFAHDFGCVIRYAEWFEVYDHWYMKFFWGVLLAANVLECVFLWQAWRYGRGELLPHWSGRAFALLVLAGLVLMLVTNEFFLYAFPSDPLLQLDSTLTMLAYPAFGAALLIRRGGTRGQTPFMWWNFTAMTALFHLTTWLFYGDAFRGWQYVAAAASATLGGAAMAVAVSRARRSAGRFGNAKDRI